MSQLSIALENNQRAFEPGGQIIVTAHWQLDEQPHDVELRLLWYTEGKGDRDEEIVQSLQFDSPAVSDSKRFGIQLPESPYSFSGKLISLIWALELTVAPSGETCREEFVMAPGGEEIVLSSALEPTRASVAQENET